MAVRPNFTGVARQGTRLVVSGRSEEPDEILDIFVTLSQTERIPEPAPVRVTREGSVWQAEFVAGSYVHGPAVAFGVEMRKVNSTTTTWAQLLTIP